MPLKKRPEEYEVWKKIRMIPADELDPTAYNPPAREQGPKIVKLGSELAAVGQQVPILVTVDGRIVDGHRRYSALKKNGETMIPCLFLDQDADPDEIWRSINTSSKPITGAEWTSAYSLGLDIDHIDKNYGRKIAKIEEIGGDEAINEMAMKNLSARVWDQVRRVARYVEREGDEEFLRACLFWIIEKRASFDIRAAIKNEIDPEVLEQAVLKNRKLSSRKEYVLE